jgi:acyl-CoA synthetase (NDP forming)
VEANPPVKELDLNPVFAYPEGAIAVDARINVEENYTLRQWNFPGQPGKLDCMFYPKSVAVAGASNNPTSRGYDFMQHLINFKYRGQIYPINSRALK